MAKILEQSENFLQQQETKNQQNEHKAKKMQETSANLQKAAVPAFTASEPDSSKNTTENCDTETNVAVNATGRSGDSGDQTATDDKTTTSRNCSIRK